jgi:cytochrome-b5 reductase
VRRDIYESFGLPSLSPNSTTLNAFHRRRFREFLIQTIRKDKHDTMSTVFPRLSRSTVLGGLALGGIAIGTYSSYTKPFQADAGAPPKVFGGGPAFISLALESSELVNHNTKKLRFKLPTGDSVSGLPLGSALLTISWPSGSWAPVPRPYTPITAPDEPGHIDFLVKHYPNGKQSTHLHSLAPGQTLRFAFPIKGPQYSPKPDGEHITLIAGGAGITPIYNLAQGILSDKNASKTDLTLVFGVNMEKDVLLKKEFESLEQKYPGRFRAVYTISKPEEQNSGYRTGHVGRSLLDEVLPKGEKGRVYVCGPPGMEQSLIGGWGKQGLLEEMGWRKQDINKF